MKLSENDVFRRAIRKLLESNSIYISGFETEVFNLIQEHEE